MRVVITGGTGFIGKALVSALIGKGHTVLCMGRREVDDKRERVTHVAVDLLDPNSTVKSLPILHPKWHVIWHGREFLIFPFLAVPANLAMGVLFFETVLALNCCQKVIGAGSCWGIWINGRYVQ